MSKCKAVLDSEKITEIKVRTKKDPKAQADDSSKSQSTAKD